MIRDPNTLRAYRRSLMSQADEESRALIRILSDAETRMIAQIAKKGENGVTRAQVNKVSTAINRIVLDSRKETADWLEGAAPKAGLNGLGTQAAYIKAAFGVSNWEDVPVRRIRDTFSNFERAIERGQLLKIRDAKTFAKWAGEWNDYMAQTTRSLQREFTLAAAKGTTWLDLAKTVAPDLDSLDLRGRMNSDAFARGFTRAKLTEIANETNTKATIAAGIEMFENAGVDDDRQSDECAEASKVGAHTLDWWEQSDLGPPPRHVFNCRCMLLGVLDEAYLREVEELAEAA